MVSTVSKTVKDTLTPASPGNTPTVADLAMLTPTGVVTQDDIQAPSKGSLAGSGLLTPFLAGGSILIGCALLLILRRNKQL